MNATLRIKATNFVPKNGGESSHEVLSGQNCISMLQMQAPSDPRKHCVLRSTMQANFGIADLCVN